MGTFSAVASGVVPGGALNHSTDGWRGRIGTIAHGRRKHPRTPGDAALLISDGVRPRSGGTGARTADSETPCPPLPVPRVGPSAGSRMAAVAVDLTTFVDWAVWRDQVMDRFPGRFTSHPSFPFGVTAFVGGGSEAEVEGGVAHLAWALSALIVNVPIGVSRIGADAEREALVAQARRAALYASLNLSASPASADDHPLEEALLDNPVLRAAATAVLDPLADHPDFLHTLYLYLAFDRNRQRVARRLKVHPRTVDYRLRRIAALTGRQPQTVTGASKLLTALLARLRQDIGGDGAGLPGTR